MKWRLIIGIFILTLSGSFFINACRKGQEDVPGKTSLAFNTPPGFPAPRYDFSKNPLTEEGFQLGRMLFVKSQTHRTQLENKDEVVRKINELVTKAMEKKKKRKPTSISKAAKEKRLEGKKKKGDIKEGRRRVDPHNM